MLLLFVVVAFLFVSLTPLFYFISFFNLLSVYSLVRAKPLDDIKNLSKAIC